MRQANRSVQNAVFCDVAVIGGGAAGLTAALSADAALRVEVFAKRGFDYSASMRAQGGMAAAVGKGDSINKHTLDTINAGAGLCDKDAVATLLAAGGDAAKWLEENGVSFNRGEDGKWDLAFEGGHNERRILHKDDHTGKALTGALFGRARRRANINLHDNVMAINLSVHNGECRGFYALDLASRKVMAVNARFVVLATGGAAQAYLYSTAPDNATGDGIAMAYRAGCRIKDMEFVQFHPTCLYHPSARAFLISEAMRGEGARLTDKSGRRFMENVHPQKDLAPRDIVARAIDAQMKASGDDCVFLEHSAHPAAFWRRRFPGIVSFCAQLGYDIPKDPLPVVPASHYSCGGVKTDDNGNVGLPGLYAAGEVAATGLHGANRLASNSLLECVVMGRRVGDALSANAKKAQPEMPPWDERRITASDEAVTVAHNWEELRRVMWNYVGIVRSISRLRRARRRIALIREEIEDYYRRFAVERDFLELRNLAQCAELIVEGALARRESRGLHHITDFPKRDKQARDTALSRMMFAAKALSANTHCPFSGGEIVAGAMTKYRGKWVGFCNSGCRDDFDNALAGGESLTPAILAAREKLDEVV
ncbi:MAG: L-aspartate oxidase [Gammaproteobacteria bacterium]